MKKYTLILSFLLSVLLARPQADFNCGTDRAMQKIFEKHPELKREKQLRDEQSLLTNARTMATTATTTYIVPIVFHILHLGGPENISDAQIKDEVRILNRDFGKRNPDTTEIIPVFKNIADSAGIRFVLATKDPLGNCTNGIIHHYDADTDWDDNSPTVYQYTWDPDKYLNVYVVRTITLGNGFPAVGYTYYPGTFPTGTAYDAIVLLHNYVGSIGTSSGFLTRVLTHETGHWFNLAHIFGMYQTAGIDCTDNDYVNDTPKTIGYTTCPDPLIPAQYQICTPGVSENFQNYMDYSYCCRMFTQGQCQRMQTAIQSNLSGRNNLWTTANLIATGVINPGAPCLPAADFSYSRTKTCVGTPVTFMDNSANGQPGSYSWSFPGGTPATSTASAPVVTYNSPGMYSVTYVSSNATGASAPITKTNLINVVAGTAAYSTNWSEGFENNSTFMNDWIVDNSNGAASARWQRTNIASYSGSYSVRIPKKDNTRKVHSYLVSPSFNLSTVANPVLSFKVAAAESAPSHMNYLKVYASTDCGASWTEIFSKSSAALVTSSAFSDPDFVPQNQSQWRSELVSLSAIQSAAAVNFKFEYIRDTVAPANNIYLDDINISNVTAMQDLNLETIALSVFPNPSAGECTVTFQLPVAQRVKFELYDVLGRALETLEEKQLNAGPQQQVLDLKHHAAGVYFLKTTLNGASYSSKLLIEK